jgi:hypothetical protein
MTTTQIELPDFDDMTRQIEVIYEMLKNKIILDLEIKDAEAQLVRKVTSDPMYFVGGKAPSMSFIETALMPAGLDGSLLLLRQKLADYTATYERFKLLYELSKMKVDVWRSQSANQRMSVS